jgi:ABC-type Fe3+/spermidine/putrescine transport system ATPase subunit
LENFEYNTKQISKLSLCKRVHRRSQMTPILSIRDIYKSFGDIEAIRGVSFDVTEGEIIALLGPSGCGKSTLLSIIAGLTTPDAGNIYWEDKSLTGTPPHKRGFGLMFQDFALFPHMNVYKNVEFGLRFNNKNQGGMEERVLRALDLVGLKGFEKRDISTLSGGEQQRVALARSIAPQPRLLMLDEPLGSLDRNLRERLIDEVRGILRSLHQTAIYVTHDQEEAFAIADCVVLMRAGQIEQIGKPQVIYNQPASPFAARFLELTNLLSGTVVKRDNGTYVTTEIGEFPIEDKYQGKVIVLVRPDQINLASPGEHILEGVIIEKSFRGNLQRVVVDIRGQRLQFYFPSNVLLPDEEDHITLGINPQKAIQIFKEEES